MPVVSLPDNFTDQLEQSESGTINSTDGPGVAVYWTSDGTARADIYIGLKLDGFKRYQNISAVSRNIKMQFALRPALSCKSDDVDFNPEEDEIVRIEVSYRLRGMSTRTLYTIVSLVISNFSPEST